MDCRTHERSVGMLNTPYVKKDTIKNFFPVPNAVFDLGLHHMEINIYAYLLRIEDGVFVKQAAGSAGNAMPIQRKTDGRDNCKWRNEGHPVTAWYASVTMVVGKGVLWSDTRKTATRSSTMYPRRRKRL